MVGTCAALEVLGVDRVTASPVATGLGMVRSAHGMLPNPAPAVLELLRGVPTYGRDVTVELTTPTGAALLAAMAITYGPLPELTLAATGYGAGDRDIDGLPNLVQVVLGDGAADEQLATHGPGQPVVVLEVNVDDATGEVLAHAVAALMEAGAHDAWLTPILMKKGRPAHTVSALADPALADQVAAVLMAETGSLGVRGTTIERWPAARAQAEVEVDGLPVRVKVERGTGQARARRRRPSGPPPRSPPAGGAHPSRGGLEPDAPPRPPDRPRPRPRRLTLTLPLTITTLSRRVRAGRGLGRREPPTAERSRSEPGPPRSR